VVGATWTEGFLVKQYLAEGHAVREHYTPLRR